MGNAVDAKMLDKARVVAYLKGKHSVCVSDIMEHSGATSLRIFPILFELQLENKLMVEEEEELGCPKVVTLMETSRPEQVFTSRFFDWMMEQAVLNPRKRWNYNLHQSLQDPAQRLLYALDPSTKFSIHRHCDTSETYILLRGNVDILYYDENGHLQDKVEMSEMSVRGGQVPINQYHSLSVNEPSIIMLVKDGPYEPSQEQDILRMDK